MSGYFYLLEGEWFELAARPALTAAWQRRSFLPCSALCRELLPAARQYAVRYHISHHEPFLATAATAPFDRLLWRHLVGEVLLFGARELPELPMARSTLCWLIARQTLAQSRAEFPQIQQALQGSRELTFGVVAYRPEKAGFNPRQDVARLADFLRDLRPDQWTTADLVGFADAADEEDRTEELQLARESLADLCALYARARESGAVLVQEDMH